MVEFTNLTLQDVTFALCTKGVPLDEFKILDYVELELDGQISANVAIIGQSHVWQISKGTDVLAETLLCVPHDLTASKPIARPLPCPTFVSVFSTARGDTPPTSRPNS